MTINKRHIKELYPTEKDLNLLIDRIERDIYDAEQYKTADAKRKVKRLKEFLKEVQSIK